jgi:hypothetical protein
MFVESDRMKKSSNLSKSTALPSDKETTTYVILMLYSSLYSWNKKGNKVEFYHKAAVKTNLPILSTITSVDLPDRTTKMIHPIIQ